MVLPLRNLMTLFESRRLASERGDRLRRELSTTEVAENVWSDVASRRRLGFRSTNAGPLLHGELRSGGSLEMGLFEAKDVEPLCTAAFVQGRDGALEGRLVVRPHDIATRILARFGDSSGLPRFHVSAKPKALAKTLLAEDMRSLLESSFDRAPQLHWSHGTITLVLEGIVLAHEQVDAIIDALTAVDAAGHGVILPTSPFR